MRYAWKAFKAFIPLTPIAFKKPIKMLADDHLTGQQIQTTIEKIFLTQQISQFSDLKIFVFDAQILGREVAAHLDITLGRHSTTRFNDGEIDLQILESVRGHRVFLIKSFQGKNINDGIMELLLAVSCIKKSGATSISAIIPYLPYSSIPQVIQGVDFRTYFAADIIKMLQDVGCDEIITFNCPISNPKGFARQAPFMNIDAPQIVVPYISHSNLNNPIIVGGQANKVHMRNIHKIKRSLSLFGIDAQMGLFNDGSYSGPSVKGRDILLFINLVRTGNSLRKNSKLLKKQGAKNIYCFGFHGLCQNDLYQKLINELPIKQLIMTNSISQPFQSKNIHTVSIAKLIAQVIAIIYENKSLSRLREERQYLIFAYLQKIKFLNQNKSVQESFNAEQWKDRKMNDV